MVSSWSKIKKIQWNFKVAHQNCLVFHLDNLAQTWSTTHPSFSAQKLTDPYWFRLNPQACRSPQSTNIQAMHFDQLISLSCWSLAQLWVCQQLKMAEDSRVFIKRKVRTTGLKWLESLGCIDFSPGSTVFFSSAGRLCSHQMISDIYSDGAKSASPMVSFS